LKASSLKRSNSARTAKMSVSTYHLVKVNMPVWGNP